MKERRVRALDGVRGLAVLLVTVSHAGFPLLKLGAIVGVTVFFVLSGYLITGLLLDEHSRTGTIGFKRFYRNRALRLLPALLLLLAVWAPLSLLAGRKVSDVEHGGLAALLYFQNIAAVAGWSSGGVGHTWSLSLEEQFYVVWPLLLLATIRFGRRAVMSVAAAGSAASLAARFFAFDWHSASGYEKAYYLPQATVWALLLGVLLSCAVREWPGLHAPRYSANVALAGLLLASSALGMTGGIVHSGLNYGPRLAAGPIAAVLAMLLVLAVTTREAPPWAVHPLTVHFGVISYGLYLWHDTLIGLVEEVTGSGDLVHLVVGSACAGVATGIAYVSYRWWELPFLRLKDKSVEPPGPEREPAR